MARISVDASKAKCMICMSPLGFPIFIREIEVIYIYGETTEVRAQVSWMEEVCLSLIYLRSSS